MPMSHGLDEAAVATRPAVETGKHRYTPADDAEKEASLLESWNEDVDEHIRAYRHLGNVQTGNTLIISILVGIAILGVATYTFIALIDVIASSVTVGVLLLISAVSGVGAIVYGVLRSRTIYTAATAIGFMDYLEALKVSEQNRRDAEEQRAKGKVPGQRRPGKASYKVRR